MSEGGRGHAPRPRADMLRLARISATAALVAIVVSAALIVVPALLGYQRYVIDGGSMGPAIARGSIAYDEPVPVSALRVGDVITYTPPPGAPVQTQLTHRIVSIHGPVIVTKGDSNRARDPWSFTPRGRTEARVAFHLPLLGYVLAALSLRWLRMLIVGVPALLIATEAVGRLRLARSAEA